MTESDGPLDRAAKLLEQALALPQQDRAAFLDRVCEGDAALRAMLDDMLRDPPEHSAFLSDEAHASPIATYPSPVTNPAPDSTAATRVSTPLTEGPGSRIGRYKLLQQIGEGGFGVVFMAEQERPLRRRVALKIIKLGMDTRQVIARFEAERQALAMMDHPNIAKVLDAGATDTGRPYFVMELVRGIPITQYCDANNLAAVERLNLFVPVCQAIQHAHTKGVIHRDIKPSNILVTLHDGKPVPKVIDFGIAKATDHRLTEKTLFTEHCQMIGTPAYMSPEQAEMSGLDIDTRTDVYSLGVLLYELLTGTTPFAAADLLKAGYGGMQRMIREVEPPRPSTRVSTLGDSLPSTAAHRRTEPKRLGLLLRGDLDWITMKALEKDRTRRYETSEAFAADVRRHLAGEPVVAAPPSAGYRMRKFVRKHRGQVVAASMIAVSLLIGLTASSIFMVMYREQRDQAENAAIREIEARDEAEWSAYTANIALAQAAMASQNWPEARRRIEACPKGKRGWEWNFLRLKTSCVQFSLPRCTQALFSPNGSMIATIDEWHNGQLWDAKSGVQIGNSLPDAMELKFSPDNHFLLAAPCSRTISGTSYLDPPATVSLLQTKDGKRNSLAVPASERAFAGFDGTGSRFWTTTGGKTAQLWTLSGERDDEPIVHENYVNFVIFSKDNRFILTAAGNVVTLWTSSRKKLRDFVHDETVSAAAFVANNTRVLVYTFRNGRAFLYDRETGQLVCKPLEHVGHQYAPVVSPDSNYAVTVEYGGKTACIWDMIAGRSAGTQLRHAGYIDVVTFSPDGRRIATASRDRTVRLWDASTGVQICTIPHKNNAFYCSFTLDGRRILSVDYDNTMMLSDDAGQCLGVFDGGRAVGYVGENGVLSELSSDGQAAIISTPSALLVVSPAKLDWPEFRFSSQLAELECPVFCDKIADDELSTTVISLDYARRISVLPDRTVRFTDVDSSRELAVISVDVQPTGLALSSDGSRLILRLTDGTVRVWDTREPSARQADRDARAAERKPAEAFVDALLVGDLPTDSLENYIRQDSQAAVLSRLVRLEVLRERLEWIESEAKEQFGALTSKHISIDRVRAAALEFANGLLSDQDRRDNPILRQRVGQAVANHANNWKPHPYEFNSLAWNVVKSSNPESDRVQTAIEVAREAVRIGAAEFSDRAAYVNTLGVALYRHGDYAEAIIELERSDRLYAIAKDAKSPPTAPQQPVNWAFIAMSHFKLGKFDEAKAALEKLRTLMKTEKHADDEECQQFLREAEELIEGRAGDAATQPAMSQPADASPASQPAPSQTEVGLPDPPR